VRQKTASSSHQSSASPPREAKAFVAGQVAIRMGHSSVGTYPRPTASLSMRNISPTGASPHEAREVQESSKLVGRCHLMFTGHVCAAPRLQLGSLVINFYALEQKIRRPRLVRLLEVVIADPERPIDSVDIITVWRGYLRCRRRTVRLCRGLCECLWPAYEGTTQVFLACTVGEP
jgi:hypothetical protein